jgi:predicted CoA-binding protein
MATVAESKALRRLFSPRHIAVFGGASAQEVVRQCKALGFDGPIWPVHPTRTEMDGLPCFASVDALPEAPDASFVAVPRHATVAIVRQLAARGAGGAICYASGFAEVGGEGVALQAIRLASTGLLSNGLAPLGTWVARHAATREGSEISLSVWAPQGFALYAFFRAFDGWLLRQEKPRLCAFPWTMPLICARWTTDAADLDGLAVGDVLLIDA